MRALLLALPLFVACHNADVRVTVSGIPDGATRLEVRTLADRVAPAEEGFVFDLPSGSVAGGSASFNLRMPMDRYVEVSTVAFADTCAVAAGSTTGTSKDGVTDVALALAPTARVCDTSFVLAPDEVYIPPGTYPLGTNDTPVTLSGYAIERTEVTVSAYQACIGAGRCVSPRGDTYPTAELPQVGLDWNQANVYCAWRGRRLPSEAEWERAARGPNAQPYPWGSAAPSCDRANYDVCRPVSEPISAFDLPAGASPEGALNLIGNADEWVNDWYTAAFPSSTTNPQGPPMGSKKVYRGGDYITKASDLAATARDPLNPDGTLSDGTFSPEFLSLFGARCARSLP